VSDISINPAERAKNDIFMRGLTFVVRFICGFATVILYASSLPIYGQDRFFLSLAIFAAGAFMATLVHELGHAIAAFIAGWRIIVFAVRPFLFHIPNRQFVTATKSQFAGRAGYVAAVPADRDVSTIKRWALFIAGGPAASFLFALYLVAIGKMLATMPAASAHIRVFTAICFGFAIQSACTGLLTLLPRRRPGKSSSDGWKLYRALCGSYGHEDPGLGPWLGTLMRNKTRPRDLPQWMIDEIITRTPVSARLQLLYDSLEISKILDARRPNYIQARQAIEIFRQKYGSTEWLCGCDAYIAAVHERDAPRAAQALAKHDRPTQVPELISAARAALSALQGDEAQMQQYLSDMDNILQRKSPFKDKCYQDIRRNIELLLRKTKASGYNPSHAQMFGQ